jgi:hypothetical protein
MPKIGHETAMRVLATFRALVELADFDAVPSTERVDGLFVDVPYREIPRQITSSTTESVESTAGVRSTSKMTSMVDSSPKLSIHLHFDGLNDPEQIGSIFEQVRQLLKE